MARRWFHGMVLLSVGIVLPATAPAERIDRVVAAVNNEVITLSDLRQAVRFNEEMGGASRDRKNIEAETLEGLINKRLLLHEARRLSLAEVTEQDVNAEVGKVRSRLGSDKAFRDFLQRMDMTPEQLGRMLGERLLVERFVEKKVGLFVRVGRDEARKYFDDHPEEFKGKRFAEVSKAIVALLSEEKTGQQITRYLAELRSKADIRINPI
ncbi:MAG TPA: SurA N-terminal domain-containing protein [Nitrospirota bacterium]|nr:SurA N-terminal domain-containing protein [Nitrospirota bacterium]